MTYRLRDVEPRVRYVALFAVPQPEEVERGEGIEEEARYPCQDRILETLCEVRVGRVQGDLGVLQR